MNEHPIKKIDWLLLPMLGVGVVLAIWAISSATWAKELPSPLRTWQASKTYIIEPFAKRAAIREVVHRSHFSSWAGNSINSRLRNVISYWRLRAMHEAVNQTELGGSMSLITQKPLHTPAVKSMRRRDGVSIPRVNYAQ